ncbi:MAG: ABC transporter permease [Gammaproteobacteria bacterium]
MRGVDLLRFAGRALGFARMRTALTVLGIMVGISAVTLITAIGEGVRVFVLAEFTQFGTDLLAVVPGKTNTFGASVAAISNVRPLRVEDAMALATLPRVRAVGPVVQGNAAVEFGARSRRTVVMGVGPDVPALWQMRVGAGRFLPHDDWRNARPYAVLGAKMREELFGTRNPLGERIRIGGDRYRVVGVMARKGQVLGFDLDDTIYIPAGRALEMFDRESLMEVDVLFEAGTPSHVVAADVRRVMLARHGHEDFTIVTQDKMLEVLGKVLDVLTLGVAAIGAISLAVGAVGILTIMTIAVAERTGEIGLLRALGARRANIMAMFVAEAAALGIVGGVAGVLVAFAVVQVLHLALPALPIAIAWRYVGLAVLLSAIIGLGAGFVPALRAARLHPLEALRAE